MVRWQSGSKGLHGWIPCVVAFYLRSTLSDILSPFLPWQHFPPSCPYVGHEESYFQEKENSHPTPKAVGI